jgi:hypothetical protein
LTCAGRADRLRIVRADRLKIKLKAMSAPGNSGAPVRISRVISVCEKKDIGTWRHSSRAVIRHVRAEDFLLICPDGQIGDFRAATAADWRIEAESIYAGNDGLEMVRQRVSGANLQRVNWLFQQFLKINAVIHSGLDDADVVVIWDADTVPLRPLQFVDPDSGRVCYYHGREHHTPYFITIEHLFGPGYIHDRSFIAQCFPVRVGWVRAMVCEIEKRNPGASYVDAVLRVLPGLSGSEFSEYETMGTWVMRNHRDAFMFQPKNRWLRDGSRIIGVNTGERARSTLLWLLSFFYDYVAIENWRRPLDAGTLWRAMRRRMKR